MKVSNFQMTGYNFRLADEVNALYDHLHKDDGTGIYSPRKESYLPYIKELLSMCNVTFHIDGLNRAQSTMLCLMKYSYVQQSQRYVRVGDGGTVNPFPEKLYGGHVVPDNIIAEGHELMKECFDLYERMTILKDPEATGRLTRESYVHGIPIEDGRYILPLAAPTNIIVSMTGDQFVDFYIEVRTGDKYFWGDLYTQFDIPEVLQKLIMGASVYQTGINYYMERGIRSIVAKYHFDHLTCSNQIFIVDGFTEPQKNVAIGILTSTTEDALAAYDEEGSEGLIRRTVKKNHTGVLEHQRTTFAIMMSLTAYHQQIRHRLPSLMTETLNDVAIDTTREFIVPPSIKESIFNDEYQLLVHRMTDYRKKLMDAGYQPFTVHSFLQNCNCIKMLMSANARADIQMLAERTCFNAQWEIRDIAMKKVAILCKESPVLYETALPNCLKGGCKEDTYSCKRSAEVRELFNK